jgi:Tfp pilus assembly protein PilN
MRAVNLLPEDGRERGPELLTQTSVLAGGAGVLAAVTLFVGVSYFQAHGKTSDRRHTLSALQQEVTEVQAAAAAAQAAKATAHSGDQARVAAFTTASATRMTWDVLFDDISRMLPSGSWLTSMNMQGGAPVTGTAGAAAVPTAAPTAFTVSGVAFSNDVVAQVMERLSRVPELGDVTLQSSTKTSVGTQDAVNFSMSASILPPGADR